MTRTRFDSSATYVIDGAMATELERRGADINDTLWSAKILIESPQLIADVHYDYFLAGADIAISASYQATLAGFESRAIPRRRGRELLQLSISLACAARDRYLAAARPAADRPPPLVAASIGPYGAHLHDGSEYTGAYSLPRRVLKDFHRQQLEVLLETPADLIAFETIPSQTEAEAILELLDEYPRATAWISFSCRDGRQVSHGEDFASCISMVTAHDQVAAAGLNCTAPIHAGALLEGATDRHAKPLLAYPNSGETWTPADNSWHGGTGGADLSSAAKTWYRHGARLIGGCCRTTPRDIAVIGAALRSPSS